jgi:cytochrome c-type biogenesis protein
VFISPRKANRRDALAAALCFIAGFSLVFVTMSILFSVFFFVLRGLGRALTVVSGLLVCLLGLNIIFDFIPFLNYEKRVHLNKKPAGFADAFVAGLAFGGGWTPCIGPILGSILLLASDQGNLFLSVVYLLLYSAGLGLPFVAISLFWDGVLKRFAKIRAQGRAIQITSGVFLLVIGICMTAGRFTALLPLMQKSGAALARAAASPGLAVRWVPAALFFAVALLPPAVWALKKTPSKVGLAVFVVFALLGLLQAGGVINTAALVAEWLLFSGG